MATTPSGTDAGHIAGGATQTPTVIVGGVPIAVMDRAGAAQSIISAARARQPGHGPLFFTSANGEIIARCRRDPSFAGLLRSAHQILADGQPLVLASRIFCRIPLPERVATTDLFHDVAKIAQAEGCSFYMLGATEAVNAGAVAAVQAFYPQLRIVGRSHGYLHGQALASRLEEINALAPDVLWLAMGVPREQEFVRDHAAALGNVGVIKTSGGLFDFLSGRNRRAPLWMQRAGLEWLWRTWLEPRRLFMRYLITNPIALYLLLTRSR